MSVWLLVFIIVVRALMALAERDGGEQASGDGPKRDAYDALAFVPAVAAAALLAYAAFRVGPVVGLPAIGVVAALVEPWLLARYVAIPLGWPRTAYALTRVSTWTWRADRAGGAAFAGALAAARRSVRDEAAEQWIARDPEHASPPKVSATLLAAHGLLAASRGDRGEARAFLSAASTLFDARPTPMVRVAREWLAGEAAIRGAWDEVLRVMPFPYTDRAALLSAMAARLAGLAGAPDADELRGRWERCRSVHALGEDAYRRALAARHQPEEIWPPPPDDPLLEALQWHRRATARPELVVAAAEAWERALAVPGSGNGALREQVIDDLRSIADPDRITAADLAGSGVGRELAHRIREERFARLDLAVAALGRRGSGIVLSPLDEVREFLSLKQLYEELVRFGGDGVRRQAFSAVHVALLNHWVDLYNNGVDRQGFLFRAVTRWLLKEASRLRLQSVMGLLEGNLDVSRGWGRD